MLNDPKLFRSLCLTIRTQNIKETLEYIESKWKELNLGDIYRFIFLDEYFNQYYRAEERSGRMVTTFAGLAIFLACIGLFGLAALTSERRTKEIGIRKVLGATERNVVFLLSKEFSIWVLVANVISWPVSFIIMHRWLDQFAYRISLSWWMFVLSSLFTFLIALVAVGYQAIKAALANPIDSLRYE